MGYNGQENSRPGAADCLVSVVIPCHNAEKTLADAVNSALAQELDAPMEIMLIDDGSTDGTGALMGQYREKSAPGRQVRCLTNPRALGAAAARNRAVTAAAGRYIAFLDADDSWAQGKLAAQIRMMESGEGQPDSQPPLCCTARELMTPAGKLTGRVIPVKERISYRELLKHNSINCSSVLIKTDIAREFPMAHEDSHEDYITWLRVIKKYGAAVGINEPMLRYRLSSQGKSGSKLQSAAMTYKAYRYVGFGRIRAAGLFVRYALHGVWKYMWA